MRSPYGKDAKRQNPSAFWRSPPSPPIPQAPPFDLESVSEATSGAIGSLVSTTVLYPLDTCKTKYQAEVRARGKHKYRNLSDVLWEAISTNQLLSLYQGLGTKNLLSFLSQFVYFYGYSYFKRLYLEKSGNKNIGTQANLLIAAAAGACTAIVTQPLDTASSRMQTSAPGKSKSLWRTLTDGTWSEAFDGLGISLLLTSNPAIQYTVFNQLKARHLRIQGQTNKGASTESLSAFSAFVLGAISKSIATLLDISCDQERRVIRLLQGNRGSDRENGTELSFATQDQGENHQNHMGSNSCKSAVTDAHKRQNKELLVEHRFGMGHCRFWDHPNQQSWTRDEKRGLVL